MKSFKLALILAVLIFTQGRGQAYMPAETISGKKLTKHFIEASMVYPENELKAGIQGKVEVRFMVQTDGSSTDFSIEKSVSKAIDDEALRIVKKLLWKPAIENGRNISEIQTFEIQFNTKQYARLIKTRGYDHIAVSDIQIDESGVIYTINNIDELPKAINTDGFKTLSLYIQNHLVYPKPAYDLNISGNVRLKFVIETDGIVSNIVIEESVGGGCDNEAIRILETIKWKPAIKKQLAVRSMNFLDFKFIISDRKQQAIPNRQSSGM